MLITEKCSAKTDYRNYRFIKNLFLFLLLFVGVQGVAQAVIWEEDTDGDGFKETRFYDSNNDGNPDSASVDKDRDGKEDEYWVDKDDDGDWDRVWFDSDGDGVWDKGLHDLDGDGDFEVEWNDDNGNGVVDSGETRRPAREVPIDGPKPVAPVGSLEPLENPVAIREPEIAIPLPAATAPVTIFDSVHLPWMVLTSFFALAVIVLLLRCRKSSRG